jgi:hypothetical protein
MSKLDVLSAEEDRDAKKKGQANFVTRYSGPA